MFGDLKLDASDLVMKVFIRDGGKMLIILGIFNMSQNLQKKSDANLGWKREYTR